jgi:hypothetical protein
VWIFQQKDLGACPPLGTRLRPGCSLHAGPRGYLEALCIEARGLTDKQPKRTFKSKISFRSEDWKPFPSPRWRSRSRCSGLGLRNLDPAMRFSQGFLSLLLGALVNRHFSLLARVREALTPDPEEGSWEDSAPGLRAEIGMTRIGISPSNPGMGEIKLSKSCVQQPKCEILKKQ